MLGNAFLLLNSIESSKKRPLESASLTVELRTQGYTLFQHPLAENIFDSGQKNNRILSNIGSVASIYVSHKNGSVRKYFHPDLLTVGGTFPKYNSQHALEHFYSKELASLQLLNSIQSSFSPNLIHFSRDQRYIEEEWLGEDLYARGIGAKEIRKNDNYMKSIFSMLDEYRAISILKPNLLFANLYLSKDKKSLVSSDFKWSMPRTRKNLVLQLRALRKTLGDNFDQKVYRNLRFLFSDIENGCFQLAYKQAFEDQENKA